MNLLDSVSVLTILGQYFLSHGVKFRHGWLGYFFYLNKISCFIFAFLFFFIFRDSNYPNVKSVLPFLSNYNVLSKPASIF